MGIQEDLKAINSFRAYLAEKVVYKLERYQADVLIDLQSLYDSYLKTRKLPFKIVHYVRDSGTHLHLSGYDLTEYKHDIADYIASSVSGWASNTTVNILELTEGVYKLTESLPFVTYWERISK